MPFEIYLRGMVNIHHTHTHIYIHTEDRIYQVRGVIVFESERSKSEDSQLYLWMDIIKS